MSWLSRVTNTFRTEKLDQDLYDELCFHLDERVDELVRRGHSLEEAEEAARRDFGNPRRLLESSRDAKLASWLASFLQDAGFGLRLLSRDPVSAAAVVLSLSLAIGAATTVFSLVDALLLRSLPVAHPENLIYLSYTGPGNGGGGRAGENVNFSYPMLDRLRQAGAPALALFGVSYGGPRQTVKLHQEGAVHEAVRPQWISGNGFEVLTLTPALGRLLNEQDDWPAADSVAVLSHRYWRTRFHADPSILGRRLDLVIRGISSGTYQIVGVAPPDFDGLEPGAPADLWLPLSTRVGSRSAHLPEAAYFQIRGRAYANPESVAHQLQAAFRQFRQKYENTLLHPSFSTEAFRSAQIGVNPAAAIPSYVRAQYGNPLWIIGAIVALVLIVACSNIANFLIGSAAAREREMALRMSIGAGRARLIRQMLIESGLLAAAACIGALGFAYVAGPAIVAYLGPSDFPAFLDLRPDRRLLAFLLGTGTAATLLFGLLPAWRASTVPPAAMLRAPNATTPFAGGFLRPFFTVQVAFGFVVLYLSGLFIGSFQKLNGIDLGFSTSNVSLWIITGAGNAAEANMLLAAVRQWPGVEGAAISSCSLVDRIAPSALVFSSAHPDGIRVAHIGISPEFLPVMAIPISRGRGIVPVDTLENVVVNDAFVRQILPGGDPIGAVYERRSPQGRLRQVIAGVVPDRRYVDTRSTDAPIVFVPYQFPGQGVVTIRAAAGADTAAWRSGLAAAFSQVHLVTTTDYPTILENRSVRDRLLAWLSTFLAVLTVLVVTLGLHGVLGYALARRHQELALRLAVGAPAAKVATEVFRSAARITVLGAAIGVGVSLALTPLVAPLLFESPAPLARFALPVASLAGAWILTALPAAVRVWRLNPGLALRQQ